MQQIGAALLLHRLEIEGDGGGPELMARTGAQTNILCHNKFVIDELEVCMNCSCWPLLIESIGVLALLGTIWFLHKENEISKKLFMRTLPKLDVYALDIENRKTTEAKWENLFFNYNPADPDGKKGVMPKMYGLAILYIENSGGSPVHIHSIDTNTKPHWIYHVKKHGDPKKEGKKKILRWGAISHIQVIYYGVDMRDFYPVTIPPHSIKHLRFLVNFHGHEDINSPPSVTISTKSIGGEEHLVHFSGIKEYDFNTMHVD